VVSTSEFKLPVLCSSFKFLCFPYREGRSDEGLKYSGNILREHQGQAQAVWGQLWGPADTPYRLQYLCITGSYTLCITGSCTLCVIEVLPINCLLTFKAYRHS